MESLPHPPRLTVSFAFLVLVSGALFPVAGVARSHVTESCRTKTTPLSSIQGDARGSPMAGRRVRVQATVVGVFPGLRGFFIEEPETRWDSRPTTAEGLFVYAPHLQVRQGERVRLGGVVRQYHGQTELARVRLEARCGRSTLPPARKLSPESVARLRRGLARYAGMRVKVSNGAVLADTHDLRRYGSVSIAGARLFQPTQNLVPGPKARALALAQRRALLVIDDGSVRRYPGPGPWRQLLSRPAGLRLGDRVLSLSGVVDYRFGQWRIQLTGAPRLDASNPRSPAPPRTRGTRVRVVSMNLENYFNGNGRGGGFPTPRGARTRADFAHQQARLVAAVHALGPDVLAVMEMENDGYGKHSAIAGLARALGADWRFVRPGPRRLGTDAIAVGLLYRSDRVQAIGRGLMPDAAVLDHGNRVPLGQVFVPVGGGAPVLVVANHFKSRRCEHAHGDERDQGDGQGCWNPLRTAAARALVGWLSSLGDALPGQRLLVGDFNAYAREMPLQVIGRAGYRNLIASHIGSRAYSFSYRGVAGYLDQALASPALAPRVVSVAEWHIDADEPGLQHDRPGRLPWRASDHDPLVVDLGRSNVAR